MNHVLLPAHNLPAQPLTAIAGWALLSYICSGESRVETRMVVIEDFRGS